MNFSPGFSVIDQELCQEPVTEVPWMSSFGYDVSSGSRMIRFTGWSIGMTFRGKMNKLRWKSRLIYRNGNSLGSSIAGPWEPPCAKLQGPILLFAAITSKIAPKDAGDGTERFRTWRQARQHRSASPVYGLLFYPRRVGKCRNVSARSQFSRPIMISINQVTTRSTLNRLDIDEKKSQKNKTAHE